MALPLIPIVSALTSIVPSIAGWIGGDKAEDAANHVADIARKVTGQNDPEKAVDSILKDESLKLQFMIQIENNRQALDKAYLKDRQHARESHKHSVMPAVICCFLSVCLVAFGAALMSIEVPEANQRLVDTLFGSYLTAWLSSIAYWVGSSRGSAEKSRQIK